MCSSSDRWGSMSVMVKVRLGNRYGKPWSQFVNGYVKGFAFDDDQLLEGESLYEILFRSLCEDTLGQCLCRLNGNFSAILFDEHQTVLIADKIRSYPLLYTFVQDECYVTDSGDTVLEHLAECSLEESSLMEFLAIGYVSGGKTLLKGCGIVPASTYVQLRAKRIKEVPYFSIQSLTPIDVAAIDQSVDSVLERVMLRMRTVVGDRCILIPLSGGYDSRLIACLCKKYQFRNVVCFTYGIRENPEVLISKQVAESLGFPWYFVAYDASKWQHIVDSPLLELYIRYAGNLNTTPHLQDFLAIHELLERGVVDASSVVVPGHTGDVIGGSHLPKHIDAEHVADCLLEKYGETNILRKHYEQALRLSIDKTVKQGASLSSQEACWQAFHAWNLSNRQANFIVNSVRAYEFQGLDWYLPLWDDEFANFWNAIPCAERVGSERYENYLFSHFFEPYHVIYKKPLVAPIGMMSRIRNLVSPRYRYLIKHVLNRWGLYAFPPDGFALDLVAQMIHQRIPQKSHPYIYCSRMNSMAMKELFYLDLLQNHVSNHP